MNVLEARRRLLGAGVYKKTVTGNPAVARGSLARMYPGIEMQGWTEQAQYEGNQLLNLTKKTVNSSGITCVSEGSTITINGERVGGDGGRTTYMTIIFTLQPGTYSFSYEIFNDENSAVANVVFTKHDGDEIIGTNNFTLAEETNVYIGIDMFEGKTADNAIIRCMLNEGATALPWEPYTGGAPSPSPDYPQEIVSAGEYDEASGKYKVEVALGGSNLFDVSKVISSYQESPGIINNGDGTLTVNAGNSSGVGASEPNALKYYCPDIKVGETYVLNAETTGTLKYIYLNDSSGSWRFGTSKEITESMLNAQVFFYASGQYSSAVISKITLNPGTTPLPHEPYKLPQTLTLTSDRPLTKWDKLTKKNGVWGWEYGSAEIEITEESPLQKYAADKISLYVSDAYLFGTPYSDKYVCQNGVPVTENRIGLSSGSHSFVIYDTAYLGDVELYKQWLSENPLTLWYETDTKTFVPLSEAEQAALNALHTNRPTTILSNDAGCEMSLTYKTKKSLEVTA